MDRPSLSLLEHVPFVGRIQEAFNARGSIRWLGETWYLTVVTSCIYLALIYIGRTWMSNREPFQLKRALFMWNVGLAVFSILGAISILPMLIFSIYEYGLPYSTCKSAGVFNPHVTLWAFFFVISKVVELGDTFFIVMRKSRLMFLHWYHHITVLMFSWYCLGRMQTGIGHWFATINYVVHSVMYTYYALASCGVKLPSTVALGVTVIQLMQMFLGIGINTILFLYHTKFDDCEFDWFVFRAGVLMYLSYAILFAAYFYDRYVKKKK